MAQSTPPKRRRIGNVQEVLMVGIAAIVDMVQLLIGIAAAGTAATLFMFMISAFLTISALMFSVFMTILFFFWFLLNGAPILGGRRAASRAVVTLLTAVFEFLPGFAFFPSWTIGVIASLYIIRKEDKERWAEYQKAQRKVTSIEQARERMRADAERRSFPGISDTGTQALAA